MFKYKIKDSLDTVILHKPWPWACILMITILNMIKSNIK